MLTVDEIEAAIDALPKPEQERICSNLVVRLTPQPPELDPNAPDPFLEFIKRLEQEMPAGEPTDIASNYKEYLYGYSADK